MSRSRYEFYEPEAKPTDNDGVFRPLTEHEFQFFLAERMKAVGAELMRQMAHEPPRKRREPDPFGSN